MKDNPALVAEEVTKSFTRGPALIEVLKGTGMSVDRGEGVAIVGASGTGKSTLLHLLGGLERPDKGRILYGGRDICSMNDKELTLFRNTSVGFVFQFHFLLPEFTALENVMIPALVRSKRPGNVRPRALSLLETVGLKERIEHKPGELSGGEQQRVAIARALMMSPQVLLADEPTGDLDPSTGNKVIDLLTQIKKSLGVTMVIVTHNTDLARAMDRVLILKGGILEPHDA
ncbi:MAG: ABC transporter ATP-binding protein [Bacteriovoracaceae bacterium]|jgi:lipoprotein-releasing system ATP-binding protein|nr:ABC transporter ATP-binding protein [Deltaproteobacteria bacterium]NLW67780.1 ABC transporter ATP-binding protein [Bacteriovoracaceae bacterium]HRR20280.1 ABC transporter ATP-binding protein [Desulfomonilia bacterium]HRR67842.1 ABC transporter ATP-binding protein [Desulfomonilia bacterium]HRT43897.1 ABC transporter ATP-binding protein [Desulfomonilia bacterium]